MRVVSFENLKHALTTYPIPANLDFYRPLFHVIYVKLIWQHGNINLFSHTDFMTKITNHGMAMNYVQLLLTLLMIFSCSLRTKFTDRLLEL